jgi:hypothetical protein
MEIPTDILNCTGFVAGKSSGGDYVYLGTFFIVTRVLEEMSSRTFSYAITARHVIDAALSDINSDAVYLRVNFAEEVHFVETSYKSWVPHHEASVDIVASRFSFESGMRASAYPLESMLTAEVIDTEHIGPGDDLFFPGLFARHFGEKRNIPIIRTGSLAAMRHERVLIKTRTQSHLSDVYLIEARSIGGLSGSPVFVHIAGGTRGMQGGMLRPTRFYLLGVLSGHWDESANTDDALKYQFLASEKINMGVGFVVPADKISELLKQPEFCEPEQEWVRATQEVTASPDSASSDCQGATVRGWPKWLRWLKR